MEECKDTLLEIKQLIKELKEALPYTIVQTCVKCNNLLFESMRTVTYSDTKCFCLNCANELEDKAWRYDDLNK